MNAFSSIARVLEDPPERPVAASFSRAPRTQFDSPPLAQLDGVALASNVRRLDVGELSLPAGRICENF